MPKRIKPPRGRKPALVTRLRSLSFELDRLAEWIDGKRRHTLQHKKR
jgi:hypothetical protein